MFALKRCRVSRATLLTGLGAMAASSAFVPSSALAADAFTLKFGTASINDQQHEWMKTFKAFIEKDSGGRIKVQIYPSSELGSIPRMIEGVQFNSIQGYVGPPAFFTGIDKAFEVLGIPGVFNSPAQMAKTLSDPTFRKAFLSLGQSKGLVGLGLFVNDNDALITRKPITKLSDMRGLKIRTTAGPVNSKMMSALDDTAVPMPLNQVVTAVQQGALDGIISSVAVLTPMKFFNTGPYAVIFPGGYIGDVAYISKIWFDSIPPDLQKMVLADGEKTDKAIGPFVTKYNAEQRKLWVQGGGKILTWSSADMQKLAQLWAPVGKDVVATDPAVKPIYDLLEKTAAKYK